jgi:hypothetical protein
MEQADCCTLLNQDVGCRACQNIEVPNTTVVDRRLAVESRVSDNGSGEREIDVVFAIGTSAVDAQCRAIHARKGE